MLFSEYRKFLRNDKESIYLLDRCTRRNVLHVYASTSTLGNDHVQPVVYSLSLTISLTLSLSVTLFLSLSPSREFFEPLVARLGIEYCKTSR